MRRLAVIGAVAVAALGSAPGAHAGDGEPGCLAEDEAFLAGDDEGPPHFSDAFFRTWFAVDTSTDGFGKRYLAISIEAVCDVPDGFAAEAVQLSGADGVAVIGPHTRVYKGKKLLSGRRRRGALADADTVKLTVRLLRPERWRKDEEGRVPTFRSARSVITD